MIQKVAGSAPATTPQAASGPSGGKMGKEEFLKLFVAQLKNQDPMNPMQGQELAAQLAQFSSVEQLVSLNQHMESQAASSDSVLQAVQGSSALGMMGREVRAEGNAVLVGEGGTGSVSVDVAGAGGQAVLKIFDANGRQVGSRNLGNLPGGSQSVALGTAVEGLRAGPYRYAVEVSDSGGQPVPVRTYTTGKVDGVRYGSSGPTVTVGVIEIPLGSIVQVLPTK